MPDEEIELLRSVLAHAYEKRQSFLGRLVQAARSRLGLRTARKPNIEDLNAIEKKKDSS